MSDKEKNQHQNSTETILEVLQEAIKSVKNKKKEKQTDGPLVIRCPHCRRVTRANRTECCQCNKPLTPIRDTDTTGKYLKVVKRVRVDYEVEGVSQIKGFFSVETDSDLFSITINNTELQNSIGLKDNVSGLRVSVNLQRGSDVG
ncbi:hypothetical protein HCG49_16910 [Arenibacter sp. 6A1]|uniref:hypothetical protein n=1 Tax=Arenibacter sp. 6A1 TaxID=2720391 RepID=UPI001445F9EB|nr:hypothetical protein [Arenibacter sp. 6A1]NKI28236.1 hypothetical protein [Arenibacter sp. 6A1]